MEPTQKNKRLLIGGMTCINCQNKIEKKLKSTPGISYAKVSYGTGTADVTYDTAVLSLGDIRGVIEKLDYRVLTENGRQKPDAGRVIGILAIIVSLYALLQQFGILNFLVPSQLADAKMGYGMLFVIGLITSIHCIAMCGGINLSQCIPRTQEAGETKGKLEALKPAALYNLGRVISYTAVGFVLGFAGLIFGSGTDAGVPVMAQGILKLIAGVFMVIMGINMLGIFPWFRRLQPHMPKFLARKVNTEKARSKSPLIVGLLNGFMPCGPLQSMQIVALASGNPFAGALSMFLFSLGTVPLMLGLGSVVSALGRKFTQKVMSVGAVLVVVLGLAMLSQGGSLSGLLPPDLLLPIVLGLCAVGIVSSIPFKKQGYKTVSSAAVSVAAVIAVAVWGVGAFSGNSGAQGSGSIIMEDGKQVVSSTLSSSRYPNITVQVGTPVKWVIDAPQGSINGCNNRINIQEYNISNYAFQTGENIIEFTPTKAGRFQYSCWMGMIRGSITVTEAGAAAAAGTAEQTAYSDTISDVTVSSVSGPVPAGYQIPTDQVAIAEEALYEDTYPIQKVTIELTDNGFSPAVAVVEAGMDVLWNIQFTSSGGESATQLLVPNYATQIPLTQGDNPLLFSPDNSFDFSTSDNRFYGYLKVVDDLDAVDIAAVKQEAGDFETLIHPPEIFQADASNTGDAGQAVEAAVKDGVQYVSSNVSGGGYEPIRVQKGIPVKWTLNAPSGSLNGCNNAIYIPEYGLQVELKTGENLIEFTPGKSGTFAFSCWMGMIRSSITVANEDGTVDATQSDGSDELPSCCGGYN